MSRLLSCLSAGRWGMTGAGLLCALLLVAPGMAQERSVPIEYNKETYQRSVSLFVSLGAIETAGTGFIVQLTDQYVVGMMISGFLLKRNDLAYFTDGFCVGVKNSYYFSPYGKGTFLRINTVSLDVLLLPSYKSSEGPHVLRPKGIGLESTIGHDALTDWGLGLAWGVGVSMSFHQQAEPLFSPAAKILVHLDL